MDIFGLGPLTKLTKYNILSSEENLGKCYSTVSGAYMGHPVPNNKTLSNFEKQTKGLDFEGGVKGKSGELYKETPCRNPAAKIRKMSNSVGQVLSKALNGVNAALTSAGEIFGDNSAVVKNGRMNVALRREKLETQKQNAANKAAANAAAAAAAAEKAAANANIQQKAAALAAAAAAEAAAAEAAKAANNLRAATAAEAAAAKAKLLDYLKALLDAFFKAFDSCLSFIILEEDITKELDLVQKALKKIEKFLALLKGGDMVALAKLNAAGLNSLTNAPANAGNTARKQANLNAHTGLNLSKEGEGLPFNTGPASMPPPPPTLTQIPRPNPTILPSLGSVSNARGNEVKTHAQIVNIEGSDAAIQLFRLNELPSNIFVDGALKADTSIGGNVIPQGFKLTRVTRSGSKYTQDISDDKLDFNGSKVGVILPKPAPFNKNDIMNLFFTSSSLAGGRRTRKAKASRKAKKSRKTSRKTKASRRR